MSVDIGKLVPQPRASSTAAASVHSATARFTREEARFLRDLTHPPWKALMGEAARDRLDSIADLRRLLNPMQGLEAFGASLLEDERRQRECFEALFPPATGSSIGALFAHQRGLDQVAAYGDAALAGICANTASSRMLAEVERLAGSLRSVREHLQFEPALAAPWLTQMASAAELGKQFAASWPVDTAAIDGVDWDALGQRLDDVQDAIWQLPPRSDEVPQALATSMTHSQWIMTVLTMLGLMVTLLTYLDTLEQNRWARQQAAEAFAREQHATIETREFRARLLGTIHALGAHLPEHRLIYIVGARPVPVKSEISGGVRLTVAEPDQYVVITAQKGRWVRIRYQDQAEGVVEGWVLKHYLVRFSQGARDVLAE